MSSIIDTTRYVFEVLAKAQRIASLTHQGAEVLVAAELAATADALQATRYAIEVLAKEPAKGSVTALGLEAIVEAADLTPASTDTLRCSRVGIEVIQSAPETAGVTSFRGEVIAEPPLGATSQPLSATRVGIEVLGRRYIPVADSELPDDLLFFTHNWADGCSLSSAYMTDISPAADSISEERRQLFDRPNRTLTVSWTVEGKEASDALLVELKRYLSQDMAVPLYCDIQEITSISASGQTTLYCDTTKARFFPNAHVAVIHYNADNIPTVEYHKIHSKLGDRLILKSNLDATAWPGISRVLPVVHCNQVLELSAHAHRHQLYVVEMELSEKYGPAALPPLAADAPGGFEQYAGYPILDLPHNWHQGLDVSMVREGTSQSIGRGIYVDARGDRHRMVYALSFLEDRTDTWRYLHFFDSRRGRLRPFWFIDMEDLWTALEINYVSDFVSIDPLGDFDAFAAEMDYIGIEFSDGLHVVREAVSIEEVFGVWRVTLDEALPSGYTAADVRRIGRGRLCRNRKDSMTENWKTSEVCQFDVEIIELLSEGDVELS